MFADHKASHKPILNAVLVGKLVKSDYFGFWCLLSEFLCLFILLHTFLNHHIPIVNNFKANKYYNLIFHIIILFLIDLITLFVKFSNYLSTPLQVVTDG